MAPGNLEEQAMMLYFGARCLTSRRLGFRRTFGFVVAEKGQH